MQLLALLMIVVWSLGANGVQAREQPEPEAATGLQQIAAARHYRQVVVAAHPLAAAAGYRIRNNFV